MNSSTAPNGGSGAFQVGTNDATNSHTGGPASPTQMLIGTKTFGQNQNIGNSNNAQAGQTATNEQNSDTDTNTASGTAPTIQSIFGDNQKTAQTQSISKSGGGSNTQDTVANTMANLNDSPHNTTTIQDNLFGSQSIQHQQIITKSPNSQNTLQESNQQLNTNHNDATGGVNQLFSRVSQPQTFTQTVTNSPNTINTFSKDHILQNLH